MGEKLKTILITQQDPGAEKNPYVDLAKKHKLKIDYRPFIHVEGLDSLDFRQQRIDILEHTAVIFTSRNAVDHYFRIAKEMIVVIISLLTFKYSFKIQEIYTKKAPIERDETMIRNFLNAVNGSNRMSLSNIANVANTLFTNVASKLTDGLNRITQSTPTTTTTPTKTKSTVTTATPSKKSTK